VVGLVNVPHPQSTFVVTGNCGLTVAGDGDGELLKEQAAKLIGAGIIYIMGFIEIIYIR